MTYKVKVEPSGYEFEIEAEESILEGALRNGFAFAYGCRSGSCGSCKGKVLSGDYYYEDDEPPLALTDFDAKSGMAIFCQAHPRSDMVLEVKQITAAKDIRAKIFPTRVQKMELLAPEVMRVYLKLPMIERIQFLAGQYIDILLSDGRRRSFSLANSPHEDELIELHIRHVKGGRFTTHVFEEMKEKDLLRIEGPFGSFFLREKSERPLLFMAGGTGFAPIKGILDHAFSEGISRPIYLYWGARYKELLYLPDVPLQWAAEHKNLTYIPVLSEPKASDNWNGRTGLVHSAIANDFTDLSEFDVYASGLPEMIESGREAFLKLGMKEEHFYFDSFTFGVDCI